MKKSRRKPATSHDVARIAGVSRSAVSRAFTEGASVSSGTRKKIAEAAKKLKYRPNIFARSLVTNRSSIIGLAVSALDNQYYPDVVQRMSEELATAGYRLLLFITHGSAGHDPMLDELLRYQLDALILASSTSSSALAEQCRAAGVPVIMYNNIDPSSDISSVAGTNVLGARTVAAYLMAAGHKRFGYIAGLEGDSTNHERESGFTSFLLEHDLPAPARASGHFSYDGAVHATRALLNRKSPPDAIFCGNDHMALAAIQVVRAEFGREPGKDISIVGFDNVPVAEWPAFGLTTYSQPSTRMVSRTIELIREALAHEPAECIHERIQGELMVRTSARLPRTGIINGENGIKRWQPATDAI